MYICIYICIYIYVYSPWENITIITSRIISQILSSYAQNSELDFPKSVSTTYNSTNLFHLAVQWTILSYNFHAYGHALSIIVASSYGQSLTFTAIFMVIRRGPMLMLMINQFILPVKTYHHNICHFGYPLVNSHNYGKIHHFIAGKIHELNHHFQ